MRIVIASMLLLFAGCSRGSLPVVDDLAYDPQQARELLVTVLEAWKEGRVKELARRQPPVRFVDDDYSGGWKLVDYEIKDEGFPLRPFKDVHVAFTLRNRQGQVVQRQATYQIVLGRNPAVLRTDT